MLKTKRSLLLLLAAALALAACRGAPPPATDTPQPAPTTAVATAAATTAAPPAEPSATAAADATPGGEATATLVVGGEASPTVGATVPATSTVPAGTVGGTDIVEFVADVTVPDGTDFEPGGTFLKTWQVRNAGTATWTTDYALIFVSGDQMGGPASVPLPSVVPPGQTVDISVDLTAPAAVGTYTGFWMLRNAAGTAFGLTADANQPVYVQIDVVPAGTGGNGGQPAGTPGTLMVSAAQMSVDQASITGACPQTFVFSASYTSEGAGSVTYRLQAAATTPGFVFTLPETATATFTNAGPRTAQLSYNLEFTGSVAGEVWLQILTPTEMESNRVSFSLTC